MRYLRQNMPTTPLQSPTCAATEPHRGSHRGVHLPTVTSFIAVRREARGTHPHVTPPGAPNTNACSTPRRGRRAVTCRTSEQGHSPAEHHPEADRMGNTPPARQPRRRWPRTEYFELFWARFDRTPNTSSVQHFRTIYERSLIGLTRRELDPASAAHTKDWKPATRTLTTAQAGITRPRAGEAIELPRVASSASGNLRGVCERPARTPVSIFGAGVAVMASPRSVRRIGAHTLCPGMW